MNNLRMRKSCGLLRRMTLYVLIKVGESGARLPNLLKQSVGGRRKADGGVRLRDRVLDKMFDKIKGKTQNGYFKKREKDYMHAKKKDENHKFVKDDRIDID